MGDVDLVKEVLDDLGDMRWMQVAIKPAKPFAFGLVDGVPVFGLPGNPVSSIVSLRAVRPARRIRRLAGHPDGRLDRPCLAAVAPDGLRRRPDGKIHFVRVVAQVGDDGRIEVAVGRRAGLPPALGPWPTPTRSPSCPTATASPAGGSVEVLLTGSCDAPPMPARRARRLVRARPPRPAHLGDRPLQLPVHVLHAGGGDAVARPLRGAHLRGDRADRPRAASSGSASTSIRLTGGEPTVRAHLPVLVAKLAVLGVDLSMTTNGATLALVADDLAAAGLRRVNISLDSLRRDRFTTLTRRDMLDRVLEGIDAALAAGLTPVKVNAVVMRGSQRRRGGRARRVRPRPRRRRCASSSTCPSTPTAAGEVDQVVPGAEIVAAVDEQWPLEAEARAHEPARRWRYVDGAGEIGVIPSVTDAFCSSCDRVRLTADGVAPGLPVRRRGDRPAGSAARGRDRRRPRRPARARRSPASGPATASARCTSSGPAGPCPRSAADAGSAPPRSPWSPRSRSPPVGPMTTARPSAAPTETRPCRSPPATGDGVGGAELVEPTPGLDSVTIAAIDSVAFVDSTTLEVHFYNGVEPCYGVDHVTVVTDAADAVTIEVGVGLNPDAGAVACIELAQLQGVQITLDAPLGERSVIDVDGPTRRHPGGAGTYTSAPCRTVA